MEQTENDGGGRQEHLADLAQHLGKSKPLELFRFLLCALYSGSPSEDSRCLGSKAQPVRRQPHAAVGTAKRKFVEGLLDTDTAPQKQLPCRGAAA